MRTYTALLAVVMVVTWSMSAQQVEDSDRQPPEPSPPVVAVAEETPPPSRFSLAGWCVLRSEQQTADQPTNGEDDGSEDEQVTQEPDELGCDAGAGVSLVYRDFPQGRLSLVGVIGMQSLGVGAAWTFGREMGHPLSVAVGLVAPYDGTGIYSDGWAVALGATVSLLGRR